MYHINFITVIIEKEDELRSLLYDIDISSSIKKYVTSTLTNKIKYCVSVNKNKQYKVTFQLINYKT